MRSLVLLGTALGSNMEYAVYFARQLANNAASAISQAYPKTGNVELSALAASFAGIGANLNRPL